MCRRIRHVLTAIQSLLAITLIWFLYRGDHQAFWLVLGVMGGVTCWGVTLRLGMIGAMVHDQTVMMYEMMGEEDDEEDEYGIEHPPYQIDG